MHQQGIKYKRIVAFRKLQYDKSQWILGWELSELRGDRFLRELTSRYECVVPGLYESCFRSVIDMGVQGSPSGGGG